MKQIAIMAAAAACALTLASCDNSKFKISGDIYGGEEKSLVLEKADYYGRWIPIDSVRIGKNGNFSISADAPLSPEIYRLALDNRYVYVPIDSVESITLSSSLNKFGTDFTLDGSGQAQKLEKFEKSLAKVNFSDPEAVDKFKKSVYLDYIKDSHGSIVSYYVLTKFVGDKPLFDPADTQDAKYFAAVATQFDTYRPNDPHGKMVKDAALSMMRERNSKMGRKTVISANELRVIDIALPDKDNRQVRLSDKVGKGKPVVLAFTMMNLEQSPVVNRELAGLYNSGAVDIYQVSFDKGQYEWREAVSNLPWTNVLDPAGTSSTALRDYNVDMLPVFFIYDAEGDLADRVYRVSDLKKKL
ncbi:MAG: DUF4369 domain-containing protein [Candidatus Amulumruptor caecigallinarius]|nr:DUF4369 domain-containing protein [Candidatus Amulumruptor caecigallinarius]